MAYLIVDSLPTVFSVGWQPLTAELLIFYGQYLHLIYMGIGLIRKNSLEQEETPSVDSYNSLSLFYNSYQTNPYLLFRSLSTGSSFD